MTSSITDIPKSRGRPKTGGRKPGIMVRLQPDMLAEVDAFIEQQPDPKPSRPEAVRRLAAEGLISWGVRDASKHS